MRKSRPRRVREVRDAPDLSSTDNYEFERVLTIIRDSFKMDSKSLLQEKINMQVKFAIKNDVTELIGNTPLVYLNNICCGWLRSTNCCQARVNGTLR
ncbi:hypothetical protein FF2_042984 [Malus domestica]